MGNFLKQRLIIRQRLPDPYLQLYRLLQMTGSISIENAIPERRAVAVDREVKKRLHSICDTSNSIFVRFLTVSSTSECHFDE